MNDQNRVILSVDEGGTIFEKAPEESRRLFFLPCSPW